MVWSWLSCDPWWILKCLSPKNFIPIAWIVITKFNWNGKFCDFLFSLFWTFWQQYIILNYKVCFMITNMSWPNHTKPKKPFWDPILVIFDLFLDQKPKKWVDLIWGHISPDTYHIGEFIFCYLNLWPIQKTSFRFSRHVLTQHNVIPKGKRAGT